MSKSKLQENQQNDCRAIGLASGAIQWYKKLDGIEQDFKYVEDDSELQSLLARTTETPLWNVLLTHPLGKRWGVDAIHATSVFKSVRQSGARLKEKVKWVQERVQESADDKRKLMEAVPELDQMLHDLPAQFKESEEGKQATEDAIGSMVSACNTMVGHAVHTWAGPGASNYTEFSTEGLDAAESMLKALKHSEQCDIKRQLDVLQYCSAWTSKMQSFKASEPDQLSEEFCSELLQMENSQVLAQVIAPAGSVSITHVLAEVFEAEIRAPVLARTRRDMSKHVDALANSLKPFMKDAPTIFDCDKAHLQSCVCHIAFAIWPD